MIDYVLGTLWLQCGSWPFRQCFWLWWMLLVQTNKFFKTFKWYLLIGSLESCVKLGKWKKMEMHPFKRYLLSNKIWECSWYNTEWRILTEQISAVVTYCSYPKSEVPGQIFLMIDQIYRKEEKVLLFDKGWCHCNFIIGKLSSDMEEEQRTNSERSKARCRWAVVGRKGSKALPRESPSPQPKSQVPVWLSHCLCP